MDAVGPCVIALFEVVRQWYSVLFTLFSIRGVRIIFAIAARESRKIEGIPSCDHLLYRDCNDDAAQRTDAPIFAQTSRLSLDNVKDVYKSLEAAQIEGVCTLSRDEWRLDCTGHTFQLAYNLFLFFSIPTFTIAPFSHIRGVAYFGFRKERTFDRFKVPTIWRRHKKLQLV